MTRPHSPPHHLSPAAWTALLAATAAVVGWLWLCWGAFGYSSWNDVRLAPVFGLKLEGSVLAGPDGPPNTWMYGPLPIWVMWPATWANDAVTALGVAGLINLLITLLPIIAVAVFTPLPTGHHTATRFAAVLLALALWPAPSWQFLQADNLAIGLGVLSNLLLGRGHDRAGGAGSWLAAVLAASTLACKQTSVAVPIAQLIWLTHTSGWRAAGRQAARLGVAGVAVVLVLVTLEDPASLLFALYTVPRGLPWGEDLSARLIAVGPDLALQLLAPLAVMIWFARAGGLRSIGLPSLTWLIAIPPGLAALATYGGNINSLQSFGLWLPAGSLAIVAHLAQRTGRLRAITATAVAATAATLLHIGSLPAYRWTPNQERYRNAARLAEHFPDQIWFPWHPLVTVFSDQRRYADEDGIAVRALAGQAVSRTQLAPHLPPSFCVIALPVGTPHWNVASELRPAEYSTLRAGEWAADFWVAPSTVP